MEMHRPASLQDGLAARRWGAISTQLQPSALEQAYSFCFVCF